MKGDLDMKVINLDAAKWKTVADFYDAILPALSAPDWHGGSVDALVESMVWGEINDIEPPYTVVIHSTKGLPADISQEMNWVGNSLDRARAEFAVRKGRNIAVYFLTRD